MAGGVGSRFWPLSSEERPKQFLDVLGCGKTLLQLTADRFSGVVPAENVWVVTSAAYHDLVREQLLPAVAFPRGGDFGGGEYCLRVFYGNNDKIHNMFSFLF